ncbi:MAG: Cell shape determining protein, MreB/Mrl family [Candidatus Magasanikbacteria bacterium GW2011_GWC2_40_17]|uniref:Cell shape-determining protein MreB n=1 Tax=Candidatus Magasanikbacteria bacterium GW2011_GWA2_42_32 TaxID=1619039 RepID=A0A0G1A975_9BACT|nr:MAG: Cell shape determining protein, MreB/Mrl family [Candidatus Magasanikbacteria bacterium GW2011_GWC2_40_17]KKS57519.1 MAG: Cell shape determining protein, MreB/Mrl family [Candidatus Magasanikbacteria bacterium GW2011_GWA2_42_32]OGH85234.1 MAG: rod shape-determining protein [Candidatus Magasanikbacteria bacterium RIFOXYB2_FULL_38_10]
MFGKIIKKFNRNIGIDLGTANTLVYTPDKGIVINEPSVIAINLRTEQILAVGQEAKMMLGKTPPYITVTRPLTGGIISDFEVTEKMIKYFINKISTSAFFSPRPSVVIGVPLEITEVERKAVEDAVLGAGGKRAVIVEEPMAAAIGAKLPVEEAVASMVVDIGGGTTEIAVISLSGIVTAKSVKIAGDELNKNIIHYAKEKFNLLIGETHAEELKVKIGSAKELEESFEYTIRGRDLMTGLPRENIISDNEVREAIQRSVWTIVDSIKSVLETTPPELISDIHERGIVLTGGGALLRGLDKAIEDATNIPVRIAEDPLTCVVRGTALLIERPELLNNVALPSSTDN